MQDAVPIADTALAPCWHHAGCTANHRHPSMNPMIQRLQALLDTGKDTALLRVTLGKAALDQGQPQAAAAHLERAITLEPHYSVAWKLLGKAYQALQQPDAARQAWQSGLACAQAKGDAQVVKELTVFLKRLQKPSETAD